MFRGFAIRDLTILVVAIAAWWWSVTVEPESTLHRVLSVVAGTAQSIVLAERLGLDPQVFLETIAGGSMDAPYVQLKGRAMIAGDYPAAFAVDGALKDSGLIGDALRLACADDRLMAALNALFTDAAAAGHAGEDMAAVAEVFRR